MMLFSEVLQLEIPEPFPLAEFEGFWAAARAVIPNPSETRVEFNSASNLIGWRFRSCVEYQQAYLKSWRQFGANASFEEMYSRERSLFGMFVCGVSTLESLCYACNALAAEVSAFKIPFDERARRKATPKSLYEQLKAQSPSCVLTVALNTVLDSVQWVLWNDYRNTMAHRSSVPRIIFASLGATLPPAKILEFRETWSTDTLSGDETTFASMISWIGDSTKLLLNGGIELAQSN